MVEAVNKSQNNHIVRNTAIATGVGAVGGSVVGCITKPLIKGENLTDSFSREIQKQAINVYADGDSDDIKLLKRLLKVEENPTAEAVKGFLSKYKDSGEISEVLKKSDEEILNYYNENIKSNRESIQRFIDENKRIILSSYNETEKEFNLPSGRVRKVFTQAFVNVKCKAALLWGGIAAAVLGTSAFIASKVFGNKQV